MACNPWPSITDAVNAGPKTSTSARTAARLIRPRESSLATWSNVEATDVWPAVSAWLSFRRTLSWGDTWCKNTTYMYRPITCGPRESSIKADETIFLMNMSDWTRMCSTDYENVETFCISVDVLDRSFWITLNNDIFLTRKLWLFAFLFFSIVAVAKR